MWQSSRQKVSRQFYLKQYFPFENKKQVLVRFKPQTFDIPGALFTSRKFEFKRKQDTSRDEFRSPDESNELSY